MRNIRELSIGSIVSMLEENRIIRHFEVMQISSNGEIELQELFGEHKRFCTDISNIEGAFLHAETLKKIGFIESDEKSWQLMYYCGDMRLYYKYYKAGRFVRFKFKPDFTQKQWVRIDCHYVHQLQNVMRFLTGGELEFEYKSMSNGKDST